MVPGTTAAVPLPREDRSPLENAVVPRGTTVISKTQQRNVLAYGLHYPSLHEPGRTNCTRKHNRYTQQSYEPWV